MQTRQSLRALMAGAMAVCVGCQAPGRPNGDAQPRTAATTAKKTPDAPRKHTPDPTVRRAAFTAKDNPTTRNGRGEPSLDDFFRPAAWIYVDGGSGEFIERDGNPQVQWFIEGSISTSPTFRVEAFTPLLGAPKDFACTLDTVEAADGSSIAYAIAAVEGTFDLGQDYSLLQPGENFVVRNRATGDLVTEIPPLSPGTYVIAAGVKNLPEGREGLAITYFTVGKGGAE